MASILLDLFRGLRCVPEPAPSATPAPAAAPAEAVPTPLFALPADCLLLACAALTLRDLSALAATCRSAASRLPAEAWREPLRRELAVVAVCTLPAGASLSRRQHVCAEAYLMSGGRSGGVGPNHRSDNLPKRFRRVAQWLRRCWTRPSL